MTTSTEINTELQHQASEILKQFSDGLSTVGDIALKQLPDIAIQYIHFGFWKAIFATTISVSVFIASCLCFWLALKWAIKRNDESGVVLLFPIMGIIVGAIQSYVWIEYLLMNIFAPKIWLLLQIKYLISS